MPFRVFMHHVTVDGAAPQDHAGCLTTAWFAFAFIGMVGIKPLLLAGLLSCWLIGGGAAINRSVMALPG